MRNGKVAANVISGGVVTVVADMGNAEEVITRGITGIDLIELGCSVLRCSRALNACAGLQRRRRGDEPDAACSHGFCQRLKGYICVMRPLVGVVVAKR